MQWGRKQRRSEGVVYHRPDRPSFPLPNPNGAMTRAVTGRRQEEIRVRAAARAQPAAGTVVVANHPAQVGFLAAAADAAAASSVAQAEPVSTSEEERLQLAAECLRVLHSSPLRPPDSKCACSCCVLK